jgi:4-hydroxybenzoate polyprenyltransferase
MSKIAAYAKLLRIPGIGALGIIPVIASLTMGVYDLYPLSLIFIIGTFASVFGFLVNDYVDIELDGFVSELRKKPLVSGEVSKKNALIIAFYLAFTTFFFIALLWYNQAIDYYKFIALICIIVAGILGTFYDVYGKQVVGSDFLVAISVSLIFLFGALSFGQPTMIIWIIFILTFENILYMNVVQNGIKDADHDYKLGVKNIALTMGVKVQENNIVIPRSFQAFGFVIHLFSAVLFFVPFFVFGYHYYLWQMILLVVLIMIYLFLDTKLLMLKTFNRSQIRKLIGIQSFLRYSLVPVMLFSIVGILPYFLLILIPIT